MRRGLQISVKLAIWSAIVAGAPLLVIGYLESSGHPLDSSTVESLMTWRAWATAIVLSGGLILLADLVLMAREASHKALLGALAVVGLGAHVVLAAPPKIAGMLDNVDLAKALTLSTLSNNPGPVLYSVVSVAAPDIMAAGLALGLLLCAGRPAPEDSEELIEVAKERNALAAKVEALEVALAAHREGRAEPPAATLVTMKCPGCGKPFTKETAELCQDAINGHQPWCPRTGDDSQPTEIHS